MGRFTDSIQIHSLPQGRGLPRCAACYHKPYNEWCFVHLYEISNRKTFQIGKIDSMLSSVRLQWERTAGKQNVFSAGKNTRCFFLRAFEECFKLYRKIGGSQ